MTVEGVSSKVHNSDCGARVLLPEFYCQSFIGASRGVSLLKLGETLLDSAAYVNIGDIIVAIV